MAIGVGLVGLGMAAKPHIEALARLAGRVEVRGAHCRDAGRREAFAAAHDVPVAASLDALLADEGVQAMLVLTPPDARQEIVAACATAGKAVLVEKPLERTVAAAAGIVNACATTGVPLGVMLQHRMRADVKALRDMLAAGRLGRVAAVRLTVPWWRPQAYYDEPGRGTLARDGGGVLLCQAIHALDVMLQVAGPVTAVTALARTTALHAMETEDFVSAGLEFASGACGAVMATTAAYPGATEELTLDCEHGAARLHGDVLEVAFHDGTVESTGSRRDTGAGADPMAFGPELHQAVIEDFIAAVAERRDPTVSGASALPVQQLIETIIASSAAGRRLEVPA